MGLISKISKVSEGKLIQTTSHRTDKLLGIINAISEFSARLTDPRTGNINLYSKRSLPVSKVYNDIIGRIQDDIHVIREHQRHMIEELLINWNTAEHIIEEEEDREISVDDDFPTTLARGKTNGDITLAISHFNSAKTLGTGAPLLSAVSTDTDVKPIYGKAYGLYIDGNESGEDGIRPNDNDGEKIIDGKDSFWEAEIVTLQERMDSSIFSPQDINDDELSLTVNITVKFPTPTNINSFTIIPHNFGQSAYFDITDIRIVSGSRTISVLPYTRTCFRKTRVTFDTQPASGMMVTLRQDKGYYMKYHLARYTVGNNSAWIDLTGPHLISRIAVTDADLNDTIHNEIVNAGLWIPRIWVPDSPSVARAVLDTTAGTDGYKRIESVASRRKRWAIGIQEIEFGEEFYNNTSEIVTTPYDMPDETTSVYIVTDEDLPDGTSTSYSLSFDDGNSWHSITPINRQIETLDTGHIVPQRLYINSDLSTTRKSNTLTGVSGYVNTPNRKVRVRAVMEKDTDAVNTPRIRSFTPIFDTSVPS